MVALRRNGADSDLDSLTVLLDLQRIEAAFG